jgi:UDP-3-O-[3-hydroxymyristoyl] N-acetylglucosamine deacetylase
VSIDQPIMQQRTLKKTVVATGVGLHSGEKVTLTLHPAPPDAGITFRRVDLPDCKVFKLRPDLVNDTRLSSTLVQERVRVGTIEHLMSALAGFGVDNISIDVDAPEIPILDGSAAPFIYLLESAGVIEQSAVKKFIRILQPIEVREGDKWVRLDPHEGFAVHLTIDFDHPVFKKSEQKMEIDFAKTSYIGEISRARTFGFVHEVELLRMNGLARGGSMENAIVLDEYRVLNQGGLRFDNEFARHKVLDAIGDLYVLGHQLIGRFSGHKSGHALNNRLLRVLLASPDRWEYATFEQGEPLPDAFHTLPTLAI